MYGQYRSGIHLSDTIKNYFNFENKSIDFFCSVKTYEKFYNSVTEPDNKSNKEHTELIISDIKKKYNPKSLHIIDQEKDNDNTISGHYGMYSAIIDSLSLKQEYEIRNSTYYDLVILCRYDTIIYPSDYFVKLIEILENESETIIDKTHINTGNFVFVNMSKTNTPEEFPIIDDMYFVLNNEAADLMFSQLVMCQSQKYKFNNESNTLYNVRIDFLNKSGHKKWFSIFNSLSIPYIKLPHLHTDKLIPQFINYYKFKMSEKIKKNIIDYIQSDTKIAEKLIITPVRKSNVIPDEDYTSFNTVVNHLTYWIKNQK